MTAPGKKLQDIYNSGAAKLVELESGIALQLKETAQSLSGEQQDSDKSHVDEIQGEVKGIASDLLVRQEKIKKRLEEVIEAEINETNSHLNAMRRDLQSLAERLRKTVNSLLLKHQEEADYARKMLLDQYENLVNDGKSALEEDSFASAKRLIDHGTSVAGALQQKLDQSLWESRSEEKQFNSTLFKNFMQKANSIDSHFGVLMQKISTEYQNHSKVIEKHFSESGTEVDARHQSVIKQSDEQTEETEQNLQRAFQFQSEDQSLRLETSLTEFMQPLSSQHEITTAQISGQTHELTSSLFAAAQDMLAALKSKGQEITRQADGTMAEFQARLDDRINAGASLRKNLEEEKNVIFASLKSQLSDIRTGFEKRLTTLIEETSGKVSTATVQAESEILAGRERCLSELKLAGANARSEVEAAVTRFLNLIKDQRKNALLSITGSLEAENSETEESKPESRALKRKRERSERKEKQ